MPRTISTNPTLMKKAVENVQKHPTLTVPEAMQLAGFLPEHAATHRGSSPTVLFYVNDVVPVPPDKAPRGVWP